MSGYCFKEKSPLRAVIFINKRIKGLYVAIREMVIDVSFVPQCFLLFEYL